MKLSGLLKKKKKNFRKIVLIKKIKNKFKKKF